MTSLPSDFNRPQWFSINTRFSIVSFPLFIIFPCQKYIFPEYFLSIIISPPSLYFKDFLQSILPQENLHTFLLRISFPHIIWNCITQLPNHNITVRPKLKLKLRLTKLTSMVLKSTLIKHNLALFNLTDCQQFLRFCYPFLVFFFLLIL